MCPAQSRAAVGARPGHSGLFPHEFRVPSKGTYSRASGQPASVFDYFIMTFPLINVKVSVEGLQGGLCEERPGLPSAGHSHCKQTQLRHGWAHPQGACGTSGKVSSSDSGKHQAEGDTRPGWEEKKERNLQWSRRREERRAYPGRGCIQGFAGAGAEGCSLEKLLPVKEPARCAGPSLLCWPLPQQRS